MSERALLRLVFSPVLSTATSVTEVSGRGVGMDVVLSNLSQIGGVVDVETDLGAGTCISIKLPLTLAILPSLLLGVGDQRFAIPQVNLAELHRVPVSDVSDQVKEVGHALVLKLRGSLLPLVHLDDVLQVPLEKRGETSGFASYDETRAMNIAVISVGSFKYGLIVDELLDNAEIVVKPLGRHLSQCRWYAGATVLGDGRTALILDAGGIAESVRKMELDQVTEGSEFEREVAESERRQSLLLVTSATGELCAVPLEAVERIERINGSSLTTLRGRTTYISGGLSVPLFAIDGVPEGGYGEGPLFVVVNQVAGREVGLAVSEVVDTIETSATIDDFTHAEPGIRGSFVHDARTILLLDLMGIVRHERPELADWPNASAAPASESRPQAAV